eukprot:1194708-Prorocentrum_minimum.AAC.5
MSAYAYQLDLKAPPKPGAVLYIGEIKRVTFVNPGVLNNPQSYKEAPRRVLARKTRDALRGKRPRPDSLLGHIPHGFYEEEMRGERATFALKLEPLLNFRA